MTRPLTRFLLGALKHLMQRVTFDGPQRLDDVVDYLRMRYLPLDQEVSGVIYADLAGRIVAIEDHFRGSLAHCAIDVRTVIRRCLDLGAVQIVMFHTHPHNVSTPSPSDIDFTDKLLEAADLFDIEVLDHLILGEYDHTFMLRHFKEAA